MEQIHIMLDLETWGKKPGCDLRSIGACVFNPRTGDIGIPCTTCKGGSIRGNVNDGGDCSDCMNTRIEPWSEFYIAVDNPSSNPDHPMANPTGGAWCWDGVNSYRKYPLHRDPDTVRWWNEQSAEAQAAFADPVDLREGLGKFTQWLMTVAPACGPSIAYDIRLWSHGPAFDPPILAAAYDAVGLPVPWHYRAPRDTRTAFDLAGIDDHSGFMSMFNTGTHHHALDDAISQAKAVCAAWRIVHPRSDES